MKIAIVGSMGMLAHDIIKAFDTGKGNELFLYDKHNCDLSHTHLPVKRIFIDSPRPDILINCSGYNAVDKAEDNRDACFMINSGAVERLAKACNKYGAKFVHFSSDYVFDGQSDVPYFETSETNPLSIYGHSKLLGEEAAMKAHHHLIIRTAWLFGKNGKNFINVMLKKLDVGESFKVVDDQTGSPTYTADLARVVRLMVDNSYSGLYNVTNSSGGDVTWYKFAQKIAEITGKNSDLISPCSSNEYKTKAQRPQNSVLSLKKLNSEGLIMRHWENAVEDYLS